MGPEIAKTAKLLKLQNVPKLSKMCKAQKVQKSPKTALSGLANKVPERSVSECSVCARVSIQAQTGPGALSSLPQPSPADSSQVRAQEPCPAAQRFRESASIQGASQRSYKAQESSSVPRDVSRWSPGQMLLQPLGTVPRTENHMFFNIEKTLSWAFYFICLTFKKLVLFFLFLPICYRKSAILDFYFLSAMFVYKLHFLSAILVLQFHLIFLILMQKGIEGWFVAGLQLLCVWYESIYHFSHRLQW